MPHRRATRTLWVVAGAFWAVAIGLAMSHKNDPLRSLSQGIAVTATVVAAFLWATTREPRRNVRVSSPETAAPVRTYVSTNAIREGGPITVEIPRQRPRSRPVWAPVMAGGHQSPQPHSQEYWTGFADLAETLLENREDDPGPDPV